MSSLLVLKELLRTPLDLVRALQSLPRVRYESERMARIGKTVVLAEQAL